ncbi:MAG: hypothetical protein KC474_07455 [Cyanobacteria bacterium HKST-UBA04]|nr:hypothetical protein [Cyanobacteria bacterium HKST-UBA04]
MSKLPKQWTDYKAKHASPGAGAGESSNIIKAGSHQPVRYFELGEQVTLDEAYLLNHNQLKRLEQIAVQNLKDSEDEAEAIIAEAEEEARLIIAAAQSQAKDIIETEVPQLLEEQKQLGFEAGRQEGRQEGLRDVAVQIETAQKLTQATYEGQRQLLVEQKHYMADVMTLILKRVVGESVLNQPEQLWGLIETAAAHFKTHGELKILIHPDRFALLLESDTVQAALAKSDIISLLPHPYCPKDRLVLETAETAFDLSPDVLIDALINDVKTELPELPELSESDTPTFNNPTPDSEADQPTEAEPANTSTNTPTDAPEDPGHNTMMIDAPTFVDDLKAEGLYQDAVDDGLIHADAPPAEPDRPVPPSDDTSSDEVLDS